VASGEETLAPGSYRTVEAPAGSVVSLRTGIYWIQALSVASGATLALDATAGPVVIYLGDELHLAGEIAATETPWLPLFVGVRGGFSTRVELTSSPFRGTLVAPAAEVILGGTEPHRGRFFARRLVVQAGTEIVLPR